MKKKKFQIKKILINIHSILLKEKYLIYILIMIQLKVHLNLMINSRILILKIL